MGVGAPLQPRPPGPCPGGCAAQRGGPAGQECAAGGRAAQEASGGTCKGTSRQQPPSSQTERRGAGVRAARRRAPGRGSGRSERRAGFQAGGERVASHEPPGTRCLRGGPGRRLDRTGSKPTSPRAREAGAVEPGQPGSPQPPELWEPRGAHDGGGDRAEGGRAGEAQRRAAAAVEAEALRAHRARAAALRGQGHGRPAQGAQLRPHQSRGVRREHRAPHLLHASDRRRGRDRLPLPPRRPWLERSDHPGPGQVQESTGHPDCASPAESWDWDPCVLNHEAYHFIDMPPLSHLRAQKTCQLLCPLWLVGVRLHVMSQKLST